MKNNSPHIVHVLPSYAPAPMTGADRYAAAIAEGLAKDGIRSTVITTNVTTARAWYKPEGPRLPAAATIHDVPVIRKSPFFPITAAAYLAQRALKSPKTNTSHRQNPSVSDRLAAYSSGPYFRGLVSDFKRLGATMVHASPLPLTNVLLAARAAKTLGLPFVITPIFHFDLPSYYNPIMTDLLDSAAGIIALTEFERAALVDRLNLAQDRVHVIPFGLDTSTLDAQPIKPGRFRAKHNIAPDQCLVLYAGTKGFDKGAVDVLATVRDLNRKDITLAAIGMPTPEWAAELERGAPARLVDLGYVSEQEKWEAFRDADIIAVPMRSNAFGLVFLEGWYFKKPIIGGLVGAAAEIVHEGKHGYLVPFGDRALLKRRIRELADTPALRKKLGAAGHQRLVDTYTLEVMQQAITKTFDLIRAQSIRD